MDAFVAGLRKDFGVAAELVRAVLAEHDLVLDGQRVQEVTLIAFKALRGEPRTSDPKKRKGLDRFRRAARRLLSVFDELHPSARAEIEVADEPDKPGARPTGRQELRELLVLLTRSPPTGLARRGRPKEWIGELSIELYEALREGGVIERWTCSKVIGAIMIAAGLDKHPGATEAVYDRLSRLR
jgi:hypothetical protein